MTEEDLAVLAAVKSTRVKRVAKAGTVDRWRVTSGDVAESRAWSLGGNVD